MAIDYCCTEAEILDGENQFHTFVPQEGRRRFQQDRECFLKIAALRNKLLFAGDERIIGWCRERFEKENGAWFMEPAKLRELDRELSRYGFGIDFMHPFFVSYKPSDPVAQSKLFAGTRGLSTRFLSRRQPRTGSPSRPVRTEKSSEWRA